MKGRYWVSFIVSITLPFLLVSFVFISLESVNANPDGIITVCVSGCDHTSIGAAINAASNYDVVDIATGTYTENLTVDKVLTLQGTGSGSTIINGNATNRVFTITNNGVVTITDLTLTNGFANVGGGVDNRGQLTLNSIVITDNYAHGGAMPPYGGGGISNSGSMTISKTIISNNKNTFGAGIWNNGALLLIDSHVYSNTASSGDEGGGIFNWSNGTLTINRSTISHNEAYYGGGIWNSGIVEITNSTISNNKASSYGGGIISLGEGTSLITNSTIASNTAGYGGGINTSSSGTSIFKNTIIAGNSASSSGPDCSGTINSQDYNLIQDPTGCTIVGTTNHNILNEYPHLTPLGDYGGATPTHALTVNSPAIDSIPFGENGCGTILTIDQRSISRPQDGDNNGSASCDIGAFEFEFKALAINKYGPQLVEANQPITYTLNIVNNLSSTVTNIVVTDTIPLGATYVSGGTRVGEIVSWTIPSLGSGETISYQFTVTATETITNSDYHVVASEGQSASGSNIVVTEIEVPISGLLAINNSPVQLGEPSTFTATITAGSNVSYLWDFGDGDFGSGPIATHTYQTPNIYTAFVTASNKVSTLTATTTVTVKFNIYLPITIKS